MLGCSMKNGGSIVNRLMKTIRQWQWLAGTCKRARFLISKSMDKRLSWGERLRVAVHLWTCKSCGHYRQHLRIIRRLLACHRAKYPELEGSYWKLSVEARARMKKLISEKIRRQREKKNGGSRLSNGSASRSYRDHSAAKFAAVLAA